MAIYHGDDKLFGYPLDTIFVTIVSTVDWSFDPLEKARNDEEHFPKEIEVEFTDYDLKVMFRKRKEFTAVLKANGYELASGSYDPQSSNYVATYKRTSPNVSEQPTLPPDEILPGDESSS